MYSRCLCCNAIAAMPGQWRFILLLCLYVSKAHSQNPYHRRLIV
ncbi:hypothetical protein SALWKB2_0388 [Snodgrassella alvi wkB2]|nr:hypothetical protein SALWKB2_0388 [Snodgrassella alvi wkB2]